MILEILRWWREAAPLTAKNLSTDRLKRPGMGVSLEVEKAEPKMKPIGILGPLALSACAHLPSPTASYPTIPQETSSDNVDDEFAGRSTHPATLTAVEAQKAAKARFDSPLDPDKPATQKAKQISLTPPAGKVEIGNE
jgi:hypothetical protein